MIITILRKRWRYDPAARLAKDTDGWCDNPISKNKAIKIRRSLRGRRRLEVVIHELLHAASWDQFSEEFVTELARDMAAVLERDGYRRDNEVE